MSAGAVTARPNRWLTLAVLCLALFVVVIDTTVLNVALPAIATDLGASAAQLQWAASSYLLVLAGLLLVAGSATDRFGHRRCLILGIAIFGLASAAGAVSSSPEQLIASRAVMGAGAALLLPGTLSVIMHTFDEQDRPRAIGVWMAVSSVGVAGGPILGGVLVSQFWWGAVFLINVPLAAIAAVGVARYVLPGARAGDTPIDYIGGVLATAAGAAVIGTILLGPEQGWTSSPVLVLAGLAVLTVGGFVARESTARAPMLDLGLFRNRKLLAAAAGGLLASFGVAGALFVLTQHFQFLLQLDPLAAGFRMIPLAVALLIGSGVLSVRLLTWRGAAQGIGISMTVAAAGLAVIALAAATDALTVSVGLVLLGLGVGMAGPIAGVALMSSLPLDRAGVGGGLNSTLQEAGNALGVAVLGSVLTGIFLSEAGRPPGSRVTTYPEVLAEQAMASGAGGSTAAIDAAFTQGLGSAHLVGAAALLAGGVLGYVLLRESSRPTDDGASNRPGTAGDPLHGPANAATALVERRDQAPS